MEDYRLLKILVKANNQASKQTCKHLFNKNYYSLK